jgi:plastocyanin
MAHVCRRLSLFAAVAALFALDASAVAATRAVSVGPGLSHNFVDAVSGTSTSTIAVGDTVQWTWASGLHSTTSGPCNPTCTADGLWDSGVHSTPFSYSHTATFATAGTYHYHCAVHLALMQGDIVVVDPGPAPTVTAIAPTSGPAGSGTAVVITGTNFVAGATATIGGMVATGVVFQDATTIDATTPLLSPGTLNDVTVTVNNPDAQSATLAQGWFADFTDVPAADPFHDYIEKLVRNGVTAGCGSGNYCGGNSVTRAQMAVFILKAKHVPGYAPPACAGVFTDVECTPTPAFAVDWIEQLFNEGITGGCGTGIYCPNNPVTRGQMAVFLVKTFSLP